MFAHQGGPTARNVATRSPRHRAARRWRSLPLAVAALLAGTVALPQSALGATGGPSVLRTLRPRHAGG